MTIFLNQSTILRNFISMKKNLLRFEMYTNFFKTTNYYKNQINSYLLNSRNIGLYNNFFNKIRLNPQKHVWIFPVLFATQIHKLNIVYCCEIKDTKQVIKFKNEDQLTHKEQMKRSASNAVDAAVIFLNKCVIAYLELSEIYGDQLADLNELFELCFTVIKHEDQHTMVWNAILEKRGELTVNKEHLQDLEMALDYANRIVDTASFAACLMEDDYTPQVANHTMHLVESQINSKKQKLQDLQQIYVSYQAKHIQLTDKLVKEYEERKLKELNEENNSEELNEENNSEER